MIIEFSIDTAEGLTEKDRAILQALMGEGTVVGFKPIVVAEKEPEPEPEPEAKKAPAKKAPAKEKKPEPEPEEDVETQSYEKLRRQALDAAVAARAEGRREDLVNALKAVSVSRVSMIEDEDLVAFVEALNAE